VGLIYPTSDYLTIAKAKRVPTGDEVGRDLKSELERR
jgi:hypothetical protein